MADTFRFELVSPERVLIAVDAAQVVVPGAEGDFGVLAGHAPFVSTLRPGVVEVTAPGTPAARIFVRGGFAEVEPDRLTILAQRAIDVKELQGAVLAEELRAAEDELGAATDDAARFMAERALDSLRSLSGGR